MKERKKGMRRGEISYFVTVLIHVWSTSPSYLRDVHSSEKNTVQRRTQIREEHSSDNNTDMNIKTEDEH